MATASGQSLDRGFWALFGAQFLGAFNDNLFKTALTVAITFRAAHLGGLAPTALVALCSALLVLPFALFSSVAGQLADRYAKHRLIRFTKLCECAIMALGCVSLWLGSLELSLATLFLLGTQAALFGPLKYGILPELLPAERLVQGNAYVEMGTFLAILLGTLTGGVLGLGDRRWLAASVVAVALLGYLTARRVPAVTPANPELRLDANWARSTWGLMKIARQSNAVWHSILGISWFWLLGALVLSLLPELVKQHLGGGPLVVTFMLGAFSVGVGLGALLCERLSFEQIELGLVPLGALGLSVCLAWLGLVSNGTATSPGALSLAEFVRDARGLWTTASVVTLALSGGVFTVPLYTLLQGRSQPATRARVIAANNVLNAVFMVLGSAALALLSACGVGVPHTLLILAAANALVAAYTYSIVPEFLFRLVCWMLAHVIYRLKISGRERIPRTGAALLVCNHVTFIDWLIISAASQRPIRFVMHHEFLENTAHGAPVSRRQGHPDRQREREPRSAGASLRAHRRGPGRGRAGVHFPGGQADARRQAVAVPTRRRAHRPAFDGAGGAARAARLVGQLLQPLRQRGAAAPVSAGVVARGAERR
ncbi:MAG: MFS transporter [Polyangiaceae bacterium]